MKLTTHDYDLLRQDAERARVTGGRKIILSAETLIEVLDDLREAQTAHHEEPCEHCAEKDDEIEGLKEEVEDFKNQLAAVESEVGQ